MTSALAISYKDVETAYDRIQPHVIKTPLLESPLLNDKLGGRLLVKAECLQKSGSFKYRGAKNAILGLQEQRTLTSILAFSSGNHAQGVALAASEQDIPACIVMPEDAPLVKILNTKAYGAEVVTYNRYTESREDIGARLAAERDSALIKPFDDPFVMAGQGTSALEILDSLQKTNTIPDHIIVPCSGGGLAAGVSTVMKHYFPTAQCHTAEPDGYTDMQYSLQSGKRVRNQPGPSSICDALLAPMPGELTFPVANALMESGLSASEDQVLRAMEVAFTYFRIVVEPGGACALAAVLNGQIDCRGKTVIVMASGGNTDQTLFRSALDG